MSGEGQHKVSAVVEARTKGDKDLRALANQVTKLTAANEKLHQASGQAGSATDRQTKASDRLEAAARRAADAVKKQAEADHKKAAAAKAATQAAKAQAGVDGVQRQRAALEASGKATHQQRLQMIAKEEAARLHQVNVELRAARTEAQIVQARNRKSQVRHDAEMQRIKLENKAAADQVRHQEALAARSAAATKPKGGGGGLAGAMGMGAGAAAAGMAVGAIAVADTAMTRLDSVDNVARNLPFSIEKARVATMGLVSDFDLMKAAVAANRLGVSKSEEEFAKMAGTAVKLGRSLGQDAAKSVDDLTNGLGRGSVEVLDNLGIILRSEEAYKLYAQSIRKKTSELTDAEKRQAVITLGLERGQAAAEKASIATDTYATAWAKAKIELINAADAIVNIDQRARESTERVFRDLGDTQAEAADRTTTVWNATKTAASFAANSIWDFELSLLGLKDPLEDNVRYQEALNKETEKDLAFRRIQIKELSEFERLLRNQYTLTEGLSVAWRLYAESVREWNAETAKAAENLKKEEEAARLASDAWQDHVKYLGQVATHQKNAQAELNKARAESAKEAAKVAKANAKAEADYAIASARRSVDEVTRAYDRQKASYGELETAVLSLHSVQTAAANDEMARAKTYAEQLNAAVALQSLEINQRHELLDLKERDAQVERERNEAVWEGVRANREREESDLRRRHQLQAATPDRAAAPGRPTLAQGLGIEAGPMSQGDAQTQLDMQAEYARNEEMRALRQTQLDEERAYHQTRLEDEATRAEAKAELKRLEDEQAQLYHEAELERLTMRQWADDEALAREQERQATRKQIVDAGTQFALQKGEQMVKSAINIAKNERKAARDAMAAAKKEGKSKAEIEQAGADAAKRSRGEALIALGDQLQGEAISYTFKAIAAGVSLNPVGAATNAAAAGIMFAGAAAIKARGRTLSGSGGGGGDSGGGGAPAGGGAPPSNPLTGNGSGTANNFPGSPNPNVPTPGNSAGGTAPTANSTRREEGNRTITMTLNAPLVDEKTVREIRDKIDEVAYDG